MGSPKFAALLAELLLLSHGLVVAVSAVASSYIPDYKYLWFSSCAVGFSAVIFALKVVLFHDSPGRSSVFGFSLPTKVGVAAEGMGAHTGVCGPGSEARGRGGALCASCSIQLHPCLQVSLVQQQYCGGSQREISAEGCTCPSLAWVYSNFPRFSPPAKLSTQLSKWASRVRSPATV
jgi:hypothetical protein